VVAAQEEDDDGPKPYAFFINDQELSGELGEFLTKHQVRLPARRLLRLPLGRRAHARACAYELGGGRASSPTPPTARTSGASDRTKPVGRRCRCRWRACCASCSSRRHCSACAPSRAVPPPWRATQSPCWLCSSRLTASGWPPARATALYARERAHPLTLTFQTKPYPSHRRKSLALCRWYRFTRRCAASSGGGRESIDASLQYAVEADSLSR
jgi:hypothetical protein